MAQPTIVGDSGKVNGKANGTSRTPHGASERPDAQGTSMKTRQSGRESSASSPSSRPSKGPSADASPKSKKGVSPRRGTVVPRRYTEVGADPFDSVVWERRSSVINNTDGSVVFKMEGAEIPSTWSQLATDIVVSKYFRKAGLYGKKEIGETSVRQVVYRLAHTIREAGEDMGGYFATKKDAESFEAELSYLLVNQHGAFNSPVWFNCGLFHRYGIEGSAGNWSWDAQTDSIAETAHAYERPQCSACFIQSVG